MQEDKDITQHDTTTPAQPDTSNHEDAHAPESVSIPPKDSDTSAHDEASGIKVVEKITIWVMVISAITFALISILAIWGLFGDNDGDVIGRSLGTVAVIAFASLVVNIGANMLDHSKKK
jgi:hypothetical protein